MIDPELIPRLRERYRHDPPTKYKTCPKCKVEVVHVTFNIRGRIAYCVDRNHCGWYELLQRGDNDVLAALDELERLLGEADNGAYYR